MQLNEAKALAYWLARWIGVYYIAGSVISQTPVSRDDTDPSDWGARSGISPATDAKTGCEYLRASGGGITPRRGVDGKHLGCKQGGQQ